MKSSDGTTQTMRMSYTDFRDAVPFGKYDLENSPYWPLSNEMLSKNFMPIWLFFHFHAQSILLDAFLHQFYRRLQFTDIERGIQSIIENNIISFCTSHPLNEFQDFLSFSKRIERLYNNIIDEIIERNASLLNNNVNEDFNTALDNFFDIITADFVILQENLCKIHKNPLLPYNMMQGCLSILQRKHEIGWKLARAFFGYQEDKPIPMSIVIPKLESQYFENRDLPEKFKGGTLKTLNNDANLPHNERHIRFTFSPMTFRSQELLRLPLEFFHEYISHLDECIYPPPRTSVDNNKMIIMDEGWMMYVARSFFAEKGAVLLSDLPHDLITRMRSALEGWTYKLTNEEKGNQLYNKQADIGYHVALNFLEDFLYKLPNMTKKEANELFYRLSFDLITRTTTTEESRWHSDFIRTLNTCLTNHTEELVTIVSNYQNKPNKDTIHLGDFFWSHIQQYRRTPDIPNIM